MGSGGMSDNTVMVLRGRLNGAQRNRLKSLLDMLYRPSELAEEIGFNQNQVYRVYVDLGCPHERDIHNHIWINGVLFRDWYKREYKKSTLKSGQAFCKTCAKAVKMRNPVLNETKDGLVYFLCECPYCGRRIGRIKTQKGRGNDRSG